MKSKKSNVRAALFLALIGAAFAFTACWQGTPAGGSNMPGGGGTITPGGNNSGDNKSGDTNSKNNNSKDNGSKTSKEGNTERSIEGITWKLNDPLKDMTLRLNGGSASATCVIAGQTRRDNGTYTITGNTIEFTGFADLAMVWGFNGEFKYKVEGGTLTFSYKTTDSPVYQFKKS